jgi:LPXTG-motif cell wall-anchored protein
MSIRHACNAIAAGVLMSAAAVVQTSGQTPTQTTPTQPTAQAGTQPETPITLVGCIQREADYRREKDKGRGGAVGTGAGAGNEYVLINASIATPDMPAPSSAEPCAPGGKGEAYELTGNRERDLERFVGRRIEITGMLKKHETAGTTGTGAPKPTGGVDPMGQDLQLPEVNVTSFKEVAATRPPAEAAAQPETPAQPQTPAEPAARPTGTAGIPDELPKTGSQLPLAGLIGLMALGAAFGVRSLRRR